MIIELGENRAKDILLDFFCPLSKDVEYFLHEKAIEFSKQGLAGTHLIFCSYKSKLVLIAYFSIANKFFQVRKGDLSETSRKKVAKFGNYDPIMRKYTVNSYLLGQLGKNNKYKDLISGDELLKLACDKISEVQQIVGGRLVYIECGDIPKLKRFYLENGFIEFGKRNRDRDEIDGETGEYLIQMFKYLKQ
jgi:hypothetical protein